MKKVIETDKAPAALGPYSQAIFTNGVLYASGQLGIYPETGEMANDFKMQVEQVMKNIGAVLKASDMDYKNIVKTMIFIDDLSNFDMLNTIYGSYFDNEPPARSCVQVAALPKGAMVEIEFIAQ